MDDAIQTEILPFSDDEQPESSENQHPCATRGPYQREGETIESFNKRLELDEIKLAEMCQRHEHKSTCFKNWHGPPNQKECRFQLDPGNVIDKTSFDIESGELTLRKLDGMVANFNSTMLRAIRCNMDIKFIGCGSDAKAVIYYITDYISKSQLKAHVAYATLELAVKKLAQYDPADDDVAVAGKKLLIKCANAMIGLQELSAPQVSSYLLGFEDHFTSHAFKQLFWKSFESHLNRELPSPECYPDNNYCAHTQSGTHLSADDDEVAINFEKNGTLVQKSGQVADYVFRGKNLTDLNLWDFISQVDKVKRRKNGPADELYQDSDMENSDRDDDEDDVNGVPETIAEKEDTIQLEEGETMLTLTQKIRPTSEFLEDHVEKQTHVLRVRLPTQRRIPVMIGPALPKRNSEKERAQYCRAMLLLFKPWRTAADLKPEQETWESVFDSFKESAECDIEICQILNNMQILHECKESRDTHMKNRNKRSTFNITSDIVDASRAAEEDDLNEAIGESALQELLDTMAKKKSERIERSSDDVSSVLQSLNDSGLCSVPVSENMMVNGVIEKSDEADIAYETIWKEAYEERRTAWKKQMSSKGNRMRDCSNAANAIALIRSSRNPRVEQNGMEYEPRLVLNDNDPSGSSNGINRNHELRPTNVDVDAFAAEWTLNEEQTLAFKVVANQSIKFNVEPLKMYLAGSAGTGKSRVLNAWRSYFNAKDQARRFRVCSYTGVAARNVGGMTIHSALCFSKKRPSARTNDELRSMWEGVDFLLIDEVSMISCEFLFKISETLSKATGNTNAFGGINIIFAGDFAQLPPVKQVRLYSNINTNTASATGKTQRNIMGKLLWSSVDTVVELTEVMRQTGASNIRFVELLSRLRLGECTEDDYNLLNARVISSSTARDETWKLAPIIVAENAAKDALNEKLSIAFAKRTKQDLHWYHATDRMDNKILEDENVLERLEALPSSLTGQRLSKIPLVIGMPVMVTHNFDVEGGVVNGSKGIVSRIRYKVNEQGNRTLVSCVVRIADSSDNPMPMLQEHEIPILEDVTDITFQNPYSDEKITIRRTQVPVVPAFAMTAHKAQGQTMPSAIVDLASCRGTQAPYVMVSRVTSLDGLMILRPFDKKKICSCPSQEMRYEFKRLKVLALRTKIKFESNPERIQRATAELTSLTETLPRRLTASAKRLATRQIARPEERSLSRTNPLRGTATASHDAVHTARPLKRRRVSKAGDSS